MGLAKWLLCPSLIPSRLDCLTMVIAGEMGSRLSTDDELSYYGAVGEYAGMGPNAASQASPLVGWIWWAYNANSEGERRW